ncbi:antibiotic biosynthesis monooxygenase [Microbulbifer sp. OS29]|uniref:Antibiotic biosynthesis monooxygenase n=1 Tax=Microbulbifer okhotskensis TaxID=2926617 RepID=A0A9X2EL48_9GAMM|nr:antibiotic biosynthesis monooxygenase [Microbulbifer okhotskensis]MCO1334234.1 antibiotic biosynthesis monooxygenase [Microbulbifer okhotskensis]
MEENSNASVVLSQEVPTHRGTSYRKWHQKLVDVALSCDGLIEVNLFEPVSDVQKEWVQLFQFETIKQLEIFLDNSTYKYLIVSAEENYGVKVGQQIIVDTCQMTMPVTLVVSKRVKSKFLREYKKWQSEIDEMVAKFPGFMGSDVTRPIQGVQDEWVVVLRFNSTRHLENWLGSDEHRRLMNKGRRFFEDVSIKRIGHGFEDWLAHVRGKTRASPSQWKIAMLILLVLYPIVMASTDWIFPFLNHWPLAYSTFVTNALTVFLLIRFAIPMATRKFNFWLSDKSGRLSRKNVMGTVVVILLYIISVFFFSWLGKMM